MADSTGHMDWPGAGPHSVQMYMDGVPIPYYTNPNERSGRTQVVEINAPGTQDQLVMSFNSPEAARAWVTNEYRAGRLKR